MGTVVRPEVSEKNLYFIPKHRFYELKHFCLQYPDWMKVRREIDGLPGRATGTNEYVDGGMISDPTAVFAEKRLYFSERIEMVEDAAKWAAGDLCAWMLRSVTKGVSYAKLNPPCCKEVWYAAYRRFFWLLDKARK